MKKYTVAIRYLIIITIMDCGLFTCANVGYCNLNWCLPSIVYQHVMGYAYSIISLNILIPTQNGRYFPGDIFKCMSLNEYVWNSIEISLKFVSKGPTNNITTLIQIMAIRSPGGKPLSEPKTVRLPTHICVNQPQWVNSVQFIQNTWKISAWQSTP